VRFSGRSWAVAVQETATATTALKTVVVAAVAAMLAATGTAAADPTPAPSPGYQIAGPDGPVFPGAQVYPPWCLHNMTACGFRYDPGTGTWQPKEGSQ
jgi:hypothetical protein